MGKDLQNLHFTPEAFSQFTEKLQMETQWLASAWNEIPWDNTWRLGWELEACILDSQGRPAGKNAQIIALSRQPLFTTELASYNLEINGPVHDIGEDVLSQMRHSMHCLWQEAEASAQAEAVRLGLFGVLPSIEEQHLALTYMSAKDRYRLVSERVIAMRGRPVEISLQYADDRLQLTRPHVMTEALSTSLQIHLQVPVHLAVRAYHASLWASVWLLGLASNSSLVLGKSLWHESRIGIFEQSVDTRSVADIALGKASRIHFAAGYVASIMDIFQVNLAQGVLIPQVDMQSPVSALQHLNLHNGTIWRWVRPIIGGQGLDRHIRLEIRALPAGPTLIDTQTNISLMLGLMSGLIHSDWDLQSLSFAKLQQDFYQVAKFGLDAHVHDSKGNNLPLWQLWQTQLLGLMQRGWQALQIDDYSQDLDSAQGRLNTGQTPSVWLKQAALCWNMNTLMEKYLTNAKANIPIHLWEAPRP